MHKMRKNSQVQIHIEHHFLRAKVADALDVDAKVQLKKIHIDRLRVGESPENSRAIPN